MRCFRPLALALLIASLMASALAPTASAKTQISYAEIDYDTIVANRYEVFVSVFTVSPGYASVNIGLVDRSIDEDSESADLSLVNTSAYFSSTSFDLKVNGNLRDARLTATLPVQSCVGAACSLLGQSLSVNLSFAGTGDLSGDPSVHIQRYASVTGTISAASLELFPAGATGLLARDKV